ncbi:acyltransferase [Algoriphagus yeomjeoni]|uniref:Maltose O-acetyltransferase n=1 Tax=Algoriphagus yeomjeoni TaxID=291403 RepID=A0A327PHA8_9BACT|nr:acyltransferase [Algoriphagus yeomjeoni]RAI91660.1 maltose O-acetyltransferase [Algoriphagus yeomjeoni]
MIEFLTHKTYVFFNILRLTFFWLRYQTYFDKYDIDKTFKFNGVDIEFYGEGKISIGKNSYIGNRSAIASVEGQKVTIGNNCSISHNVRIYTSNRNPLDIVNNKEIVGFNNGNIVIGDNCWIGANVFINQGIKIGDNVVIGANSVVTKNFPSNVIVAGCPAKILNT